MKREIIFNNRTKPACFILHVVRSALIIKNMATIKDLKEWLNRFPDDTIIEFGIQQRAGNYESYGAVNFESPNLTDNDIGDGWEFTDFRSNQFVKKDAPCYGKCYLRLGESS